MKKILLLLFLFAALYSSAQYPITVTSGNTSTLQKSWGSYGGNIGYVFIGSFGDTTAANLSFIKNVPGQVIRIGDELWIRNNAATAWNKIGSGGSTDTTSLSNRINQKVNISDTASMLSPYLRKIDTTAKWVGSVYQRKDTLFYKTGSTEYLIRKADYVNIKDFGAVDDNSTDNSTAIAAAIAAAYAARKAVFIPSGGIFKYSTDIDLTSYPSLMIFGMGRSSQLKYTGTLRGIKLGDSVVLKSFRLTGNGKTSGHAFETGVYCDSHINWQLIDMWIDGFGGNATQNGGGGIYMGAINGANSEGGNIINCRVLGNNAGINLEQRAEYINIIGGSVSNNTVGIGLGTGNFSVNGVIIEANGTGVKIYNGTNNGHGVFSGCLVNHSTTYALDIQDIAQALGVQFSACDFYYGSLFFKNANNVRFSNCNISSIDSIHLDNSYFVSFTNTMLGKTGTNATIPIYKYNSASDIEQFGQMRFSSSEPVYSIKQVNADTILWKGAIYHTGTTPASSSSSDSVWVKDHTTNQWKLRSQGDISGGGSSAYGNTGNIQIDSAGFFRTPQLDSLTYNSGVFKTKGTILQGNDTNYVRLSTVEIIHSSGGGSSTSYSNTGGNGNRTSSIPTLSTTVVFVGSGVSTLINGNTTETVTWTNGGGVTGAYLRADFGSGASKVIDEIRWYQSTTATHGTWKVQGSNDGSTWTDIGSSFTLGGFTPYQTISLSGNTTGYRYYQLLGVSGSLSSAPYIQEIEFKIADASGGGGVDTIYHRIQTNGHDLVLQDSVGKVGIGTITPGHKLDVNGAIRATDSLIIGKTPVGTSTDSVLVKGADSTVHAVAQSSLSSTPTLQEVTDAGATTTNLIKYSANYGGSYDARTLVDKNYVDSARNKARDSVAALSILSKSFVIESPTSSEDVKLFYTDVAITISKVADVIMGSSTPSVTYQISHASTANSGSPNLLFSSGRAVTSTSGATTTTFNDATIPAGSWVWITTSAQSGTVNSLSITLTYTND